MPLRSKTLVPTACSYALVAGILAGCWLAASNAAAIEDPAPAPPAILSVDEQPTSDLAAPPLPAALSKSADDGFGNPLLSAEGVESVSLHDGHKASEKTGSAEPESSEPIRFVDLGQLKELGTIHRISAIVDPSDDADAEVEIGSLRLLPRGALEALQWASQQQPEDAIPFPDSAESSGDAAESPSDASADAEQPADGEPASPETPDTSPTPIPPLSIGAMGFPSINAMTIDVSVPAAEGDSSLAQPEDQAGPLFERHGDHQEYRHRGNVGLDPAFFLQPAEFCYQPLYFEELNLERFGTCKFPLAQPVLSGAHFFATVPAMPYLMSWKLPRRCYYDTAEYFPGRQAPWQRELPPLRLGPSAVEAAAITGAIIVLP